MTSAEALKARSKGLQWRCLAEEPWNWAELSHFGVCLAIGTYKFFSALLGCDCQSLICKALPVGSARARIQETGIDLPSLFRNKSMSWPLQSYQLASLCARVKMLC